MFCGEGGNRRAKNGYFFLPDNVDSAAVSGERCEASRGRRL